LRAGRQKETANAGGYRFSPFYHSRMAHTLLLSEIFPPKIGGTARLFFEIYNRMPAGEFTVLCGDHPEAAAFDSTHNLPILRMLMAMRSRGLMNLHDAKRYAGVVRTIRRLIRERGIEQIHCGRNLFEGFAAYLVKKFTGTPYLVYIHGEDIGAAKTSRELAWMTRRIFASASLLVANSQNTRRMLHEEWLLPEAKTRLLHPGVDAQRLCPAVPDPAWRAEMGWADRTVILTVSRLQKRKGQDTMIRALPAIRARFPEVLYAVVGNGEEDAALKQLAIEVGQAEHVQFLGAVNDERMANCYHQCDLFALPNRKVGADFEGFGMVLLEAQACGKPVIAGANGGTAETMQVPETGRLVNCDGHELLAATVIELLSDPAEMRAMGERARAWALGFDWPEVAKKAAAIFGEVTGMRR